MLQVLEIGPLVLPVSLLFVFAAVFTARYVGTRAGDTRVEVESVLCRVDMSALG